MGPPRGRPSRLSAPTANETFIAHDPPLELHASGSPGCAPAATSGIAESALRSPSPTRSRPGVVLAIVSTGVILTGIDLFIVNVALPQIGAGLDVRNIQDLSWLLNAYTVVFAALLIPMGRLADRSNRKWGFLLGIGIFTAASACCAAANSLSLLIACRAAQGAGAALLTPTSLGLLLGAYPPERRAGAVRIWTAMGGMAAGFGPVVGGLLVQASWRWVFLVNVPIGVAAVVIGAYLLASPSGDRGPLPDGIGTILLIGSVAATVLALVNSDRWHWDSVKVVGLLIGSAIALALCLIRSTRHPSPVLEVHLLRIPGMGAALVSMLLFCAAFGAMILSLVLLAENTWGWSALQGGLAATPNAVLVLPASMVAGVLLARTNATTVITAGCGSFAMGILWWHACLDGPPAFFPHLLIGLVLTGVGVGFAMPTLFGVAASALPPDRTATGSGLVIMVRQIGLALGVAVLVAVLATGPSDHVSIDALERGWIVIAIITVIAPLPALFLPRYRGRHRRDRWRRGLPDRRRVHAHLL
jgi:EmrB/QacA subfamily drug resistance transporter